MARIVLSVLITLALYSSWPQLGRRPGRYRPHADVRAAGNRRGCHHRPGRSASSWRPSDGRAGPQLERRVQFRADHRSHHAGRVGRPGGVRAVGGGLIFLALGLDREVIRTLAYSLQVHPAGAWIAQPAAEAMIRLGGDMLALAVRLALPAIALLVLMDIALGLLGRLNAATAAVDLGVSGQDDWRRWCCWAGSRCWFPGCLGPTPAWSSARCARRCASKRRGTCGG